MVELRENIKVLSVDIFDTLIFRALARPKDLLDKVYIKLLDQNLISPVYKSGDFMEARVEADRALSKKGTHFTLEEIYASMSKAMVTDIREMVRIEVETECEYCYLNPEIYELIKKAYNAGKKIYITSDMYLKKEHMVKLLTSCGISCDYFTDILISCDYRASKKDGNLYRKLLELSGTSPTDICHIGDNYMTDVKMGQTIGLQTIYYPIKDYADVHLIMEKEMEGDLLPQLDSLRKYVAYQINNMDIAPEDKYPMLWGAIILGPFYAAATEWLIETLIHEKISKVFFMMREGVIFKMLFDRAMEKRLSFIESDLFYSSRNSMFLPGLEEVSAERINAWVDRFKKEPVTLSGAFSLFGVESFFPNGFADKSDLPLSKADDSLIKELKGILDSKEVLKAIELNVKAGRDNCLKYIEKAGLNEKGVALVDLGYKGTVQTQLDMLSAEKHLNILYVGSAEIIKKLKDEHQFSWFYSGCGNEESFLFKLMNSSTPFETLMMRGEGCTVGYDGDGTPILSEVYGVPKEQFDVIHVIHDGICFYQDAFLSAAEKLDKIREVMYHPEELLHIIGRGLFYPTLPEVRFLAQIYTEENYGIKYARNACLMPIATESDLKYARKKDKKYWRMALMVYNKPLYYLRAKYLLDNQLEELCLIDMVENLNPEVEKAIIVGAGLAGERMLGYCMACGIEVLGFMDNDVKKHNSLLRGLPVYIPGTAIEEADAYLVASIKYKDVLVKQFRELYGDCVY